MSWLRKKYETDNNAINAKRFIISPLIISRYQNIKFWLRFDNFTHIILAGQLHFWTRECVPAPQFGLIATQQTMMKSAAVEKAMLIGFSPCA